MNRFLTALVYKDSPRAGFYLLTALLAFDSERIKMVISADIGFETNFVTGRKLLVVRRIVQDKMNAAAVIHDQLYGSSAVPRDVADAVFRDAMLASDVAAWRAWAAWAAVRAFGSQFYKVP